VTVTVLPVPVSSTRSLFCAASNTSTGLRAWP
jgi:hypothetical protein